MVTKQASKQRRRSRDDMVLMRRNKARKQLCRGAIKLFSKKGYNNTTMREIAKASGITLGNLYNYIEKKEDILFFVQEEILKQLYELVDVNIESQDDPVEQLTNMLREVLKLTVRFKEELLFIYTETKYLQRKYLKEVLRRESEFVAKFESLLEKGTDQGVFDCKNPALSAKIIVSTASLIVALRGWNIFPQYSAEELFDETIRLFLKGVVASHSS